MTSSSSGPEPQFRTAWRRAPRSAAGLSRTQPSDRALAGRPRHHPSSRLERVRGRDVPRESSRTLVNLERRIRSRSLEWAAWKRAHPFCRATPPGDRRHTARARLARNPEHAQPVACEASQINTTTCTRRRWFYDPSARLAPAPGRPHSSTPRFMRWRSQHPPSSP